MDYVIEEIFEIICDVDKVLTVKFRLEGDNEDTYREINDTDYYEWCYEIYSNDGIDLLYSGYEEEDGDYFSDHFNLDIWNMYYSNEDSVIDFMYDTYIGINSLPSSIRV
jgi:hypothetical protein